jgi:hypothetical protein
VFIRFANKRDIHAIFKRMGQKSTGKKLFNITEEEILPFVIFIRVQVLVNM